MTSVISFIKDQYTTLDIAAAPCDINESCYIVTGANTGLGYECAKHLLLMGVKRIILAVRTVSKGDTALATLRHETGRPSAGEVWPLDLTSLSSVEEFARKVGVLERLDAIICNAGVIMSQYSTVEGRETTLQVNVVATMLLAFRSMPKLQESAKKFGIQPRLTVVSSDQGLGDNVKQCVEELAGDGNVFNVLSEAKNFSPFTTYPRTKLLEIYIVRELAEILPLSPFDVIINTVSPGLCYSQLDRNQRFPMTILVKVFRALFARSTEKGSRTLLQASLAGPESHGKYCSECRVKDENVPTWISDPAGKRVQQRVLQDLLEVLKSSGHSVDIESLKKGNVGKFSAQSI